MPKLSDSVLWTKIISIGSVSWDGVGKVGALI